MGQLTSGKELFLALQLRLEKLQIYPTASLCTAIEKRASFCSPHVGLALFRCKFDGNCFVVDGLTRACVGGLLKREGC